MAYEVVQFAELIFHIVGISNLRYNALINILISNFMIFGIIYKETFNNSYIFYWIGARVISRGIKHMYNFYIYTLGRFQIVWMDYFRFNSFYIIYPAELITMAVALFYSKEVMQLDILFENQYIPITWAHISVLFVIFAAVNFASTSYYLHNKRQELISLYIDKYTL